MPDANTEGGRLNKLQKDVGICNLEFSPYVNGGCKSSLTRLSDHITPSEGSRIVSKPFRCGSGTGTVSGTGTTQERVREILERARKTNNSVSEGVRIAKVIQDTAACSPPPPFYTPIVPTICPPMPPPPAPPARACPLAKNQKF